MLFRRRRRLGWKEQGVRMLWPRHGWGRTAIYLWHRVHRLGGTPHAIALGFAIGIGVSCTPFLGLHTLMALALAWLVGGGLLASVLGTLVIGNPLVFPLAWFASYWLGVRLLAWSAVMAPMTAAGMAAEKMTMDAMMQPTMFFSDVVSGVALPLALGSFVIGTGAGVLSYVAVRYGARVYQARRRRRLAERGRMDARSGL